jgi:hypothetical protein
MSYGCSIVAELFADVDVKSEYQCLVHAVGYWGRAYNDLRSGDVVGPLLALLLDFQEVFFSVVEVLPTA